MEQLGVIGTRVFLVYKPYQTPIRPQSFWVCSINFCRTRCGMTLRDLSRPNRIVEAGQDVMLSCLALVVNVCCKAIPIILIIQYSQYTVYNLKNLRCLQTLLTCTWWYCIGLDREATSSFVLEEHRTIIQILVERRSKNHHRCHHFHRTFLVSLFFFSLYYVSINCKSYKNSYRGDVHQSYWHHYSTVLSKIVILDLTPCRALHEHGHKLQGYRHVVVSQSVGAHAPRAQIKRRLVAWFCFIWLCGIFGMCEDWRTGCVHADVLCCFCSFVPHQKCWHYTESWDAYDARNLMDCPSHRSHVNPESRGTLCKGQPGDLWSVSVSQ